MPPNTPDRRDEQVAYYNTDPDRTSQDSENGELSKLSVGFALNVIPNLPQGAAVLDIPCGVGHQAHFLAADHRLNVTAVDGAANLIERAQAKYSAPQFVHAYFQDLDGDSLVPDESQDAVFCFNHSFGYLPTVGENEALLRNMFNKLKPGGQLFIETAFNPNYQTPEGVNPEAGKPLRRGPIMLYHPEDGHPVEHRLPDDYPLPAEDGNFRDLFVTNTALVYEDGHAGPRKKYANYLAVKHDGDPDPAQRKPLDCPVLRALARHAGIESIQFHSQREEDGSYLCAIVMKKPESNIEATRERIKNL